MTDMRGNQPKSPTARRETRTLKITFRRFTALYDVARVTGYWLEDTFMLNCIMDGADKSRP